MYTKELTLLLLALGRCPGSKGPWSAEGLVNSLSRKKGQFLPITPAEKPRRWGRALPALGEQILARPIPAQKRSLLRKERRQNHLVNSPRPLVTPPASV